MSLNAIASPAAREPGPRVIFVRWQRLNVSPTLARTLRSTNAVESTISICRTHSSNVKRWRDGQMALRWCAAGMVEAGKQFRRVNGHLHLRSLRDTLERVTEPVGATGHTDTSEAA